MRPLTFDDLLPIDEYARQRRELFSSLQRYKDRYRKVRIGPQVTLLFENRQTLWFLVQEVLRVARLAEPDHVQQQLDLYNRLLPGRNCLQAALMLGSADPLQQEEESARWQRLSAVNVVLQVGEHCCPARLVTCRPEDRCLGTSHWLQFQVDAALRRGLADPRQPARFAINCLHYRHESPLLSEDVRQSLLEDLELSDRDG